MQVLGKVAQAAAGAEDLGLGQLVEGEGTAIGGDEAAHGLGEPVGVEVDFAHAPGFQRGEGVGQERTVPERQERLGGGQGHRAQTRAQPGTEDEGGGREHSGSVKAW